jgi:competence protein ComEC
MMTRIRSFIVLLVLALALPFLQINQAQSASPKLTVSVIDVGQGDSILVQFPDGEDMLIDAGTRDAGQAVSKIDILCVTHPHEDHIGGMADVLANFTVEKVWDSGYVHGSKTQERLLQTIKEKGIRYGKPKAGFSQSVGTAKIDVLAPVRELSGTDSDANNNSIVFRISYGKISFLFTGDMEGDERATVGTFPKTTVLKVAHHGSRNGTDRKFLSQVKPQIAIISYAIGNSYGQTS